MKHGVKMGESTSIARFVGRKYGYYPLETVDAFECDWLVDTYKDVMEEAGKVFFIKDEKLRKEATDKLFGQTIP